MASNPPINFESLVKLPTGKTNRDYPYTIKARDLMKNFIFATLDIDTDLYEEISTGEHVQRRLKIKGGTQRNQLAVWNGYEYTPLAAPPTDGTYVLGSEDGTLTWLATEDCEEE